jgi:hypothetical protein
LNTDQILELLENEGVDVSRDTLQASLHPDVTEVLASSFSNVEADEGTLWLLDTEQEKLVPVWNSGCSARQFVGHYWQPLDSGLISLACVAEQPLCENSVYENADQNRTLDLHLAKLTCAMIAVPLRLSGGTSGVVSCVRLKNSRLQPDPPAFSVEDLAVINRAVHHVQQKIDPPSTSIISHCSPRKQD